MNQLAIVFGVVLIAIGMVAYFGSQPKSQPTPTAAGGESGQAAAAEKHTGRSLTALIPAGFGLPLLICGLIGLQPGARKHAMHAAAGIAAIGMLMGGGRFLSKLPALINAAPGVNQRAVWFTGILALVCLIYVLLSIQSFVAARRKSQTAKS